MLQKKKKKTKSVEIIVWGLLLPGELQISPCFLYLCCSNETFSRETGTCRSSLISLKWRIEFLYFKSSWWNIIYIASSSTNIPSSMYTGSIYGQNWAFLFFFFINFHFVKRVFLRLLHLHSCKCITYTVFVQMLPPTPNSISVDRRK